MKFADGSNLVFYITYKIYIFTIFAKICGTWKFIIIQILVLYVNTTIV